ncbi:aldo/keto reductase family protein [Bacillus salacetis]|uniref:aldo/keto reductase family protein n=1 Tax=Bacillus salacetis TaxID=2315464 RepID=UPI003BA06EEF
MKYNKLGNSGLMVSEVSLGSYLTFGDKVNEYESAQIVHKAFELGVNSFDTANVYQEGEAERILAKALKSFPRDEYILSTKAFWPTGRGPTSRGLSRKHLVEQVNVSLNRMELDYIDIFYCHNYDSNTPVEETLRTLDDMIRQGKILYAGVSNWSASQLEEAIEIADSLLLNRLIVNQCEYSLLKRDIEHDILPVSEKLRISQIVFSPLAQGILTGKYQNSIPKESRAQNPNVNKFFNSLFTKESFELVRKIQTIADQYDVSLTELALTWVLQQENVASALVGASSAEQIERNIMAVSRAIPAELYEKINLTLSS